MRTHVSAVLPYDALSDCGTVRYDVSPYRRSQKREKRPAKWTGRVGESENDGLLVGANAAGQHDVRGRLCSVVLKGSGWDRVWKGARACVQGGPVRAASTALVAHLAGCSKLVRLRITRRDRTRVALFC